MGKGRLIVIEGACDGIGKSTQYRLLRERLLSSGYAVAGHHFPSYGKAQAAPVEAYLRGEYGSVGSLSPYFVNALYAVDRAVTWHKDLREHYLAGEVILLDRYTTSSLIYQASQISDTDERREFIRYVTDFEYGRLGIGRPDSVIFLWAPYGTAASLREARESNDGISDDLHERDGEYMRRVYDLACELSDTLGWHRIICTRKDGSMRTREEIHSDVFAAAQLGEEAEK